MNLIARIVLALRQCSIEFRPAYLETCELIDFRSSNREKEER